MKLHIKSFYWIIDWNNFDNNFLFYKLELIELDLNEEQILNEMKDSDEFITKYYHF